MDCTYNNNPLSQILGRFGNQENRIFQGVEDGQINPAEFKQLEGGEFSFLKTLGRDEQDGSLSPCEQRQLNQQANGLGHDIYRDRHDWDGGGGCGGGNPEPWPPIGNGGGGGFQPEPWPPIGNGGGGGFQPEPWPPIGGGGGCGGGWNPQPCPEPPIAWNPQPEPPIMRRPEPWPPIGNGGGPVAEPM